MIWYTLFLIYAFWIIGPYVAIRAVRYKKIAVAGLVLVSAALFGAPFYLKDFLRPDQWIATALFVYFLCFILMISNVVKRENRKKASASLIRRSVLETYQKWEQYLILFLIAVMTVLLILVPISSIVFGKLLPLSFFKWLVVLVIPFGLMWEQRYNRYNLYALLLFTFPASVIASTRFLAAHFPFLDGITSLLGTNLVMAVACTAILGYYVFRQREEW